MPARGETAPRNDRTSSERPQAEIEQLVAKRDRGETLTPEEAARVAMRAPGPKEEHAMPPQVKIPREPDTSE